MFYNVHFLVGDKKLSFNGVALDEAAADKFAADLVSKRRTQLRTADGTIFHAGGDLKVDGVILEPMPQVKPGKPQAVETVKKIAGDRQ